jgi:RNA polymerase sigma-54 factor
MQIKQRLELRRLLAPQMQQSLKILALPLPELKDLVNQELENNPLLEESVVKDTVVVKAGVSDKTSELLSILEDSDSYYPDKYLGQKEASNITLHATLVSRKMNLQEVLLRQLSIMACDDEQLKIGEEIIGNIDDNGYLKASIEEIAKTLGLPNKPIENTLKLIQQFEPSGVGARSISECLLIQLSQSNEQNPLIKLIMENHLEDVAKKRFQIIAKSLKQPLELIEPLIKDVLKFDPKPGRNYSQEHPQHIIPDIIIDLDGDELKITINNEDLPTLHISRNYRNMLKNQNLDQKAREFLMQKLSSAIELLRSITRRQSTLRRIIETVADIQQEAIKKDLSLLKPLNFHDVSSILDIHETTVCRAIMNKYVKIPSGVVALKNFFPSSISNTNGQCVSSSFVKKIIKTLIEKEDKKKPLTDKDICEIISKQNNLKLSRRTVAKYREELKILSTSFRRER